MQNNIPPKDNLALCWEVYANEVLPKNASEVQKRETRRAFYFGAKMVFQLITDESLRSESDHVQRIEDTYQELQSFFT